MNVHMSHHYLPTRMFCKMSTKCLSDWRLTSVSSKFVWMHFLHARDWNKKQWFSSIRPMTNESCVNNWHKTLNVCISHQFHQNKSLMMRHHNEYTYWVVISNMILFILLSMHWKYKVKERERLSWSAFFGTEDIGVHIVHISRVIITYTLEYLSSLT